jgi:hypothetical protein
MAKPVFLSARLSPDDGYPTEDLSRSSASLSPTIATEIISSPIAISSVNHHRRLNFAKHTRPRPGLLKSAISEIFPM